MRFQFEAAQELRNRGVNHERIKKIYMIADEKTGPVWVESRCTVNFKAGSGETKNIAKKDPLRQVVLSRIHEYRQKNQKNTDYCKMYPADRPENRRTHRQIRLPHTITSNAEGRLSPSTITFTGPSSSNSTRFAPARAASGWLICVPVNNRGSVQISPARPIGPQRTYSIEPSPGSAFGAIIIFPPVNLLLLKVKNRLRLRFHSPALSRRW